ncbi:hypothetical protein D3Z60_17305 [Lachnospiraceae bacterium]|nr:hypothetical protein [Lachnospiraceae bacterium]
MYKIKRGIYEFEESLVKGFYKAKVDNYLYFGSGNCDSSFHCQYSSLAGYLFFCREICIMITHKPGEGSTQRK